MHIEVLGDESIGQQARSYAEYRLFTALARAAGSEEVTLGPQSPPREHRVLGG